MSEHALSPAKYVAIGVVLILLTGLTVSISFIPLHGVWHIAIGLTIALCKATLVVLFFMHVIYSDRVTWIVLSVACFWLGILLAGTLSDYFTREMVPHMPGH